MSLAVDELLDRRRLKRSLTFWRIFTLVSLVGIVIAVSYAAGIGKSLAKKSSPHIARISISGFITEDQKLIDLIDKARKSKHVKGVIIKMDSPGGATVGGEAIYEAVRALAKKKPTVTSVGGLAASAGYMIATASDHIVARRSSLVGSIGVLFQYPDVSKLMDIVGVKMEEIKSSPLKAEPSPFHPASEDAKNVLRELIKDSFGWFRGLVKERRNLDDEEVDAVATGRIFSGAQGVKNKLIDAIGGEETARSWLSTEKGLSVKLKTIDWKKPREKLDLLSASSWISWLGRKSGLLSTGMLNTGPELYRLGKIVQNRMVVDGLLSVWHTRGLQSIKEGDFR